MAARRWALVFGLAGCGGPADVVFDPTPADPPVEPTPPAELAHEGETMFALDTTTEAIGGALVGAPTGASLELVLASAGGRRALVYRDGPDADLEIVAEGDWIFVGTGVANADGDVMFCWNHLSGPESARNAMPHPSGGVPVTCRLRDGERLRDAVVVASDAPSWLLSLVSEGQGWVARYHRNPSGWLVDSPGEGDGIYEARFTSDAWSTPSRVADPE